MSDELEPLKPAGVSPELARWNVEDLKAYIAKMKSEISRVEAVLAEKDGVNAAAAALFGKSTDNS
jgi:uncharacterized small protein (DUF1192 family)